MNTARVLILCTVAAAGACHRDSDAPPPDASPGPPIAAPAVAKKGPTAQQQTVGMVEAASQGQSQLPVQLKFDLADRPTLGRAVNVNIAVIPQIDATGADIQLTGGDGLVVLPAVTSIDLAAIEAGQVYRRSITVTPTRDGVLLLSLTVSLKHDDTTEARVFSIPLIVER